MTGATQTPDPTRKSFGSDNHSGTHPAVMRAIVEANTGDAIPYGGDPWTEKAVAEIRRLAGAQGEAHLVLNGSGANVLGLGLLLDRHESVICAESAHINTDECGSAERLLGTKLLSVPAPDGKLTPELIAGRLAGRETPSTSWLTPVRAGRPARVRLPRPLVPMATLAASGPWYIPCSGSRRRPPRLLIRSVTALAARRSPARTGARLLPAGCARISRWPRHLPQVSVVGAR